MGRLLARLGLVRIADYGLVLTPDNRILSTRPAVLDDGLGGKIVGWHEGDLAAMELERWQPIGVAGAKPSPAKLVALPPPPPKLTAKPLPGVAAPSPIAGVQAAATVQAPVAAPLHAPAPVIAPPAPVQVAPAAPPEEDEWEWEIAVAKARAAADPIPADNWPKTQELREDVKRWEPEPAPRHLVMPHQRVATVPAKPSRMASGTMSPHRETTKVRPVVTLRNPEASRFEAKTTPAVKPFATEQPTRRVTMVEPAPKVEPKKVEPKKIEPAKPTVAAPIARTRAPSKHEETIRTFAAPPANDDHTDTAISLPPAPVVAPRSASVPTSASRRVAQRQR